MEAARLLSGTIGRIRDILGQMSGDFSPIDLTDAVHGALLLAKGDLNRAGTQLSCSGLEKPCRIRGNQEEIQLAVLNLLRNALEASGDRGRVRVSLRTAPKGAEVEVADSGPGFDVPSTGPDQLLMASSKREGLGVGLYLVRRVMERHGGSVSFGSAELGGASVILHFPWSLPSSQRS
jgi:signal transduction histidine kinase